MEGASEPGRAAEFDGLVIFDSRDLEVTDDLLLQKWPGEIPVCRIFPETPGDGRTGNHFQAGVPAEPGVAQTAVIMEAMRKSGIVRPILLMRNLAFARFWRKAYGALRLVDSRLPFQQDLADERFRSASSRQLQIREWHLFLERHVDRILARDEADVAWFRRELSYHGAILPLAEIDGSPAEAAKDWAAEVSGKKIRFPHRLDVLIVVDREQWDPGRDLPPLEKLAEGSRFRIVFADVSPAAVDRALVSRGPIDWDGFDVAAIHPSAAGALTEGRIGKAIDSFPGYRALLLVGDSAGGEKEVPGSLHGILEVDGAATLESIEAFEAECYRRMAGVPCWQLHGPGDFLRHEALVHEQLMEDDSLRKLARDRKSSLREDFLHRLETLSVLEEELDRQREAIAIRDREIAESQKQWDEIREGRQQQRKPEKRWKRFWKKLVGRA